MTLTATDHPSYLALDRAALGARSPDLERHVRECAECSAYLSMLAEPPPASGLVEARRRLKRYPRRSTRWLGAAAATAAAAAALLFITVRPTELAPAPYVGVKGFASVWIYVKRGADTRLWDGKSELRPGDRLRLKVDPGSARHVEVYAATGTAAPERLYAGEVVPGRIAMLPDAWELDGEAGAEQLLVVFSDAPVEPEWPAWQMGRAAPGVLVLPFVLPKSAAGDADAIDGSP